MVVKPAPPNRLTDPSLAKPRVVCPHPEKIRFPTERAARRYARLGRYGVELDYYPCSCGGFHVTTARDDEEE